MALVKELLKVMRRGTVGEVPVCPKGEKPLNDSSRLLGEESDP